MATERRREQGFWLRKTGSAVVGVDGHPVGQSAATAGCYNHPPTPLHPLRCDPSPQTDTGRPDGLPETPIAAQARHCPRGGRRGVDPAGSENTAGRTGSVVPAYWNGQRRLGVCVNGPPRPGGVRGAPMPSRTRGSSVRSAAASRERHSSILIGPQTGHQSADWSLVTSLPTGEVPVHTLSSQAPQSLLFTPHLLRLSSRGRRVSLFTSRLSSHGRRVSLFTSQFSSPSVFIIYISFVIHISFVTSQFSW